MKYRLKQKEVIVVSWNDKDTQDKAIKQLIALGCTNVEVKTSNAGTAINFNYLTPNSNNPEYYGNLFNGHKLVFEKKGVYPDTYSNSDFENLFEPVLTTEKTLHNTEASGASVNVPDNGMVERVAIVKSDKEIDMKMTKEVFNSFIEVVVYYVKEGKLEDVNKQKDLVDFFYSVLFNSLNV